MRARATSCLLSVAAVAILAASLLAAPGGRQPQSMLELMRAAGAVVLSADRDGTAILQADGLRPGGQVSGELTLRNQGSAPLRLVAAAAPDSEVAGLGGGRLSDQLEVALLDVTDPAGPQLLASGTVARLASLPAGTLGAGEARRLRVVATLPASAGNDVQGARLVASFTWTATGEDVTAPSPATPEPSADPSGPPATGAVRAEQVVALPSARVCTASPSLSVRLRRPTGVTLRSATVYVNGRRAARASGRALTQPILLRRLPRRALRVKVVVTTGDGQRLQLSHAYRACR